MKQLQLLIALFALSVMISCKSSSGEETSSSNSVMVSVTNPSNMDRSDVLVSLDPGLISSLGDHVTISSGDQIIPYQLNDLDMDGEVDELVVLVDLPANGTTELSISASDTAPSFTKRTQAEISHKINGDWKEREYMGGEFKNVDYLRVPPEHTDHSWFIRYEGPGWESDLVGYRFYLDWRNATDIFGKKTDDMVLQNVGQDGFDSYHEPADWGMDVLKVGSSLGLGAFGIWTGDKALRVEQTDSVNCRILLNGPIKSQIQTRYFGWDTGLGQATLTSDISIAAGSRQTVQDISLSAPLPNICTGIVKHPEGKLISKSAGDWSYIATWGKQSLAEDMLGMAVLYQTADLIENTEDEHSHVVVLRPTQNQLSYRYLATWEQDAGGIATEEAFSTYLDNVLKELNNPVTVK